MYIMSTHGVMQRAAFAPHQRSPSDFADNTRFVNHERFLEPPTASACGQAKKVGSMAKTEIKTAIVDGGLRYRTKTPGSPFAAASSFGAATMSCFLCGKHRARSMLKSRKLLGKNQVVCSPSCTALNEPQS
jgi:hypothetical protein